MSSGLSNGDYLRANNLSEIAAAGAAAQGAAQRNLGLVPLLAEFADHLFSDGFTANRRGEATFGAAGAMAGQAGVFLFELDVPTANPAANHIINQFAASANDQTAAANSFCIFIGSGGADLYIQQRGVLAGDRRLFTLANFRSNYSGQRVRGVVVLPGNAATTPAVYIQGEDVSNQCTLTVTATPPNWMPTTLDTTKFCVGLNSVTGRFVAHAPILGNMNGAEAMAWSLSGILPTRFQIESGNLARFSDDFSTAANWTLTGAATIAAGKLNLTNGDSCYGLMQLNRGASYSFTITIDSITAGNVQYFDGTNYINFAAAPGTYTVPFVAGANYSYIVLRCNGGNAVCDTFLGKTYGQLARWVVQPVSSCFDSSTNRFPLLLADGILPVTDRQYWIIQAITATNGNERLLGVPFLYNDQRRHILDDWCMTVHVRTPNASAGSSSGAVDYKVLSGLVSGRNMVALVTKVPGSANLWCGSNSVNPIQHTVRGHLVM